MDKVDFNKIGFRFKFPDECHMVLIFREGNSLCAVVSFYGGISTIFVELCKNYKGNIKKMNIEGYIYMILVHWVIYVIGKIKRNILLWNI